MHKAGGGSGSGGVDDSDAAVARRPAQSEYTHAGGAGGAGGGASRPRRDSGLEITNLSQVLRSSSVISGKAAATSRHRGVSAPPAPGSAAGAMGAMGAMGALGARPRLSSRTSSGGVSLQRDGLDRRQSTSALQFFDRQKSALDCPFSSMVKVAVLVRP